MIQEMFGIPQKNESVYAIVLEWPSNNTLLLKAPIPGQNTFVSLLGYGKIPWSYEDNTLVVTFPALPVSDLPCLWAWVIELLDVK